MDERVTSEDSVSFVADVSSLDRILRRVLQPGRFFVAASRSLRITVVRRQSERWEVFNGQLLGPSQTRQQAVFDSWRIYLDTSDERAQQPLVEVKWNVATHQLFIVRSVLIHGWETYEPRPNVIESRAAEVWTRELVGWLAADQAHSEESFEAELASYVRAALKGTSRLAITSLESPLPDYGLGNIAYFASAGNTPDTPLSIPLSIPLSNPIDLVSEISLTGLSRNTSDWPNRTMGFPARRQGTRDLSTGREAHPTIFAADALEVALLATSTDDIAALAAAFTKRLETTDEPSALCVALLRAVFNQIVLAPYSRFVDNVVDLLRQLAQQANRSAAVISASSPATIVDTISYMLRHLVRHLTAFDLKVFHNQGANYPDALFLDRLLSVYLDLICTHEQLFLGDGNRLRRRALRQAYWLRQSLEAMRFPDTPASPGENQRVLPAECPRVPEQQILDPATRSRTLFEPGSTDALITRSSQNVFRASLVDLEHAPELCELGMAVFLDRPLGVFHPPGHADRTPLVSYEAFSRRIAMSRLGDLCQACDGMDAHALGDRFPRCSGVDLKEIGDLVRPGVVSLADAAQVSEDFVFLRTTRSSLDGLLANLEFHGVDDSHAGSELHNWLTTDPHVLLIRTKDNLLVAYDRQMKRRCVMEAREPIQYELRWGNERLSKGVRIDLNM